jgi:starch phosphorylase
MPADSTKIPYLPEPIAGLERLALNLWWRWDRRARNLFRTIDPAIWSATRHNPVATLRMVDPNRLGHLSRDKKFLAEYWAVLGGLDQALDAETGWFRRTYPNLGDVSFAYFCAEFGLHNSIPIYSGGLGILAGDHCKSASDLGVPLIGVGLLYSKGYFDQKLNHDGWQQDSDEKFDSRVMPLVRLGGNGDDTHAIAVVNTAGRPVHIGAWRLDVGRMQLYLLDTNLPENDPEDRELTYKLYGGGQEHRLKQEWILGVGGVRVLRALGVSPGVWHANEGHATFMMVERLSEYVAQGLTLDEAVARVRACSVFTTHTPVPAGHDIFYPDLIDSVCGDYYETSGLDRTTFLSLGRHPHMDHGAFHMTGAAIRLARHLNGVSRMHGVLTQEMWTPLWPDREPAEVPIGSITNGVHVASWMSEQVMLLLDELFGAYWEIEPPEGEVWDKVLQLDDKRIWDLHYQLKTSLIGFCRELARDRWKNYWKDATHLVGAGPLLSPGPITIGFARRFATYKRASLLFRDEARLRRLLTDRHRPVQLVFAGKAHPADNDAKHILQRVWRASRDPGFEGRIAFVEDYDVHVAHRLVQGVDLWLNLPRVPLEACGTSGMKAALNFVPQLSTLDGWWAEGFNGANGWAIPNSELEDDAKDAADHEALFTLLEREVVPAYYERDELDVPRAWVARMKQAMIVAAKSFTSHRMVKEYVDRFYAPAVLGPSESDDPPTDQPVAATPAEAKPELSARA